MGSAYSLPGSASPRACDFGRVGYERAQAQQSWAAKQGEDLTGHVVVVTGANRGLGLGVCRAFAARGGTVHMLCRDEEKGERARADVVEGSGNAKVHLHICDLSSRRSVRGCAAAFLRNFGAARTLVHCASQFCEMPCVDGEGMELALSTVLGGAFLLTALMLPTLAAGAAAPGCAPSSVVHVVGDAALTASPLELDIATLVADPSGADYEGCGLLMHAQGTRLRLLLSELWGEYLARLQHEEGAGRVRVVSNAVHPGWIDTLTGERLSGLGREQLRTTEQGADAVVWMAGEAGVLAGSGRLYFDRAVRATDALASLSELQRRRLWSECEQICGLSCAGLASQWKRSGPPTVGDESTETCA